VSNAAAAARKRTNRVGEPVQLEGEEWRSAPGFPGYEVSSFGRVRAIRILSTHFLGEGYECVGLYGATGRQRNQRINRLVCEAFNGPPSPGLEAAHLDGQRTNNRADNLVWATPKENAKHKLQHGTYGSKLTPELVLEIRRAAQSGEVQAEIARRYAISQTVVSHVHTRRIWSAVEEEAA
jgi:hypothetical protein